MSDFARTKRCFFFDVAIFSRTFFHLLFLFWRWFFTSLVVLFFLLSHNSINVDVNTNLLKIHKRIWMRFCSVHSNQSRSLGLFSVGDVQKNGANAISYGMLSRYFARSQKLCANYSNINLLRALCSFAFFTFYSFEMWLIVVLARRSLSMKSKDGCESYAMNWIQEIQKSVEHKLPDSRNRSSLFVTEMAVFFSSYLDCGSLINPAHCTPTLFISVFFLCHSKRARKNTALFCQQDFFCFFIV